MSHGDPAGQALAQIVEQWTTEGPLRTLYSLVGSVWRTNVDRYEPNELGDDALSLGVQSSRNLCNRAVRDLAGMPGVVARDVKTLEVGFAGRVLHTSKAPSSAPTWEVQSVDWSTSEVRHDGAVANSQAYLAVEGTLFEDQEPLAGQPADPLALKHLHLTWQGLVDGSTRSWVGFPCLGRQAWFAVTLLDPAQLGEYARPDCGTRPTEPDFDALDEPPIGLGLRPGQAKDEPGLQRGA